IQTLSDVFCDNEYGANFLFRNNGDGTFTDVAQQAGVEDPMQHGRGVALADFNRDGKTDIVYGNWNGPHRLYMQLNNRKQKFKDIASQKFSMPSPVRTVIAADFDNDNELEVFFNNIAYRGPSANRLFRVSRREHGDPQIEELNVGEASEPEGRGTGAVATDFDGDGRLELLVSHGESAAQPLSVYKVNQGTANSWLRVIPRTRFGAFARGAKVVVYTKKSGPHTRIIDGGSGYLCEMEPVAHFGLGKDVATNVEVYWPDGRSIARPLEPSEINSVLEIHYPRDEEEVTPTVEIECGHGFALNENGRCTDKDECTQFPSVCPSDRPVCTNTYGSYKCRAKRRCNQGFEPNDDGSACVGEWSWQSQGRLSWITKIRRTKEALPGGLLWGDAVFWGTQVVGPFFLAALRLHATTHLHPPSDWTAVAVAVCSPSQLPPWLNGDVQKLSKPTFHKKKKNLLLLLLLLHGSLLSLSISYLQPCPSRHRCYASPLGSRPPLDYQESYREHARWELRGSQLTVSHPQSPHVITWHLS
uniref:EGF-like calcium-binding domain-containing protein n=1 Tax=Amphiprion ocellaris TaxID=80972 RepID=A0AAQ5YZA3_AMPOC